MIDRFQGDPKLYLDPGGSFLKFVSGQPEMDAGFNNQVLISLFTGVDWWGNDLITNTDEKIGSDFESVSRGSITLSKLNDIRQSANDAIDYHAFGDVEIEVKNPVNNQLNINIVISPPGRDSESLVLLRNGQNWINQANEGNYNAN